MFLPSSLPGAALQSAEGRLTAEGGINFNCAIGKQYFAQTTLGCVLLLPPVPRLSHP